MGSRRGWMAVCGVAGLLSTLGPAMGGCGRQPIVQNEAVMSHQEAITAGRLVYERANLTAFSTASVPALKKAAFAGPENGARSRSRSARVT